ncbi:sulfotransferase [Alphaproteobacteria bacterium LSUCC0684]
MTLSNYPPRQVFIIGAARSGTKFLRECLSASKDIYTIPYDISFIWRFGSENCQHDELLPSMLTQSKILKIKSFINYFLKYADNSTFFLDKTVSNTLRVSYLNVIYPDALFIHLTRDGRAVVESSIRQWNSSISISYILYKLKYFPLSNYKYALWFASNFLRSLFSDTPRLWGPRYNGIDTDIHKLSIEDVCSKQWSRCVDIADKQLSLIDSNRVTHLKFEDLVDDSKFLYDICSFIGISDSDAVVKKYDAIVRKDNNIKSFRALSTQTLVSISKYAEKSLIRLGYL